MSYPWGTERRINAYSDYFHREFGGRIQKITLDAGFSCPNRDGTCGRGGCTFCDNSAFNPSYNQPGKPIADQIQQGMEFHRKRYRRVRKFLAYFQAYSNTYAPLELLKTRYEEALSVPGVAGIVIGTRPDCVDDEKLDYIASLANHCFVAVEYGIESVHNRTLRRVNRGHDVAVTEQVVRKTADRGIRTGGHLIIGLPGERRVDFFETVRMISRWPLHSVKFHQLQLIRGTGLEKEFRRNPADFEVFSLNSYLDLMMELLECLRPDLVVERIAGEIAPHMAVREGWGIRYDQVLRSFEELLERHDSWQGKKYMEE